MSSQMRSLTSTSPQQTAFRALSALLITALVIALLPLRFSARAAGETVSVWLTSSTGDGRTVARGLEPQANVSFAADVPNGNPVITIDESKTYQRMDGFGASFTDSSAWLVNKRITDPVLRDQVMRKIFSPSEGIGLSFLRNPMGASDFARSWYTYDDMPAGQADPTLTNFSINYDKADVVPLTKWARQLNPNLKVMGSPWSPPAWMKTYTKPNATYPDDPNIPQYKNPLVMGYLQPQYYGALAQYFVKYIKAYELEGIPINYVSIQNEPTCCIKQPPMDYPGMHWSGPDMRDFIKNNLLPAFQANGITTRILALDFNWGDSDKLTPILSDPTIAASPLLAGSAWHGYWPVNPSDYNKQTTFHNQYPAKETHFTERSGGTFVANQIKQDFQDMVGVLRNWSQSFVKWNLALDENRGPIIGGCDVCTGLITVHNNDARAGQVDYTIEYYTMGHLSKFVTPGAQRIDSTAHAQILNVAFKNPDGSKVLIAYNDGYGPMTFKVKWGAESFNYTLQANTGATFKWAGTAAQPQPQTIRIEAGGAAGFTDSAGNAWVADAYSTGGGGSSDRGAVAIANTVDDKIYQTERWGSTGYAIPVANSTYTVKLHFAETYAGITAAGQRVFNVNVEGQALNNFDIFAQAGGRDIALVKTFSNVTVTDGVLNIGLAQVVENTSIDGVEVIVGTPTATSTAAPPATATRTRTSTTGTGATATRTATRTSTTAQPAATRTSTPIPSTNGSPWGGVAAAVPGTIQVENFNTGGQGVAYNDIDAANQGGQYRTTEGVDIEASSDAGGGYNAGWADAGEWLKYTVNVTTAGSYNLTARVASQTGGASFHVEVDGVNATGALAVGATGGWQTWADVTRAGISLQAGQHVLRLVFDAPGGNYNYLALTSGSAPGTNLVVNAGFEASAGQAISGWQTWSPNASEDADYSETYSGAHGGTLHGTHYKASAYTVYTYQTAGGLANGLYTLRAWVKGGGGQTTAQLEAKDYGGALLAAPIGNLAAWTQVSIPNIQVTSGQLTFGFYSVAGANQFIYFDDVELFRQ
jgi:glucosylceramidase